MTKLMYKPWINGYVHISLKWHKILKSNDHQIMTTQHKSLNMVKA